MATMTTAMTPEKKALLSAMSRGFDRIGGGYEWNTPRELSAMLGRPVARTLEHLMSTGYVERKPRGDGIDGYLYRRTAKGYVQ